MVYIKEKRVYLAVVLLLGIMAGCSQTAPSLRDGELVSCFDLRDCLYRNAKNKDKSVCNQSSIDCGKDRQENRTKARLEYCEKNRFKGMTTNECRLFLNQK